MLRAIGWRIVCERSGRCWPGLSRPRSASNDRASSERCRRHREYASRSIAQLFHSLDPSPFHEKRISTRTPSNSSSVGRGSCLAAGRSRSSCICRRRNWLCPRRRRSGPAIGQFFAYRAQVIGLELKELFRVGRRALAIGLTVLLLCVIASRAVTAKLDPRPLGKVIAESLLIFAWVANWRPIEIFLYEWWPIVRRRDLYRRLADAEWS